MFDPEEFDDGFEKVGDVIFRTLAFIPTLLSWRLRLQRKLQSVLHR